MKRGLILIILLLLGSASLSVGISVNQTSQISFPPDINWTEHAFDLSFGYPGGIECFDFDDDGDYDVFAASIHNEEIVWWENDGNQPPSWIKHPIDSSFIGAIYVQVADIDDDGDNDVVGAAWDSGEIAWWRNDGGYPVVWSKQLIRTGFIDAHEVFVVDIDGDFDIDVLGASAGLHQIVLWRNNGDFPVTWSEEIISMDVPGARSVYADDLDGDGDLDIVGAAFESDEILYWLNDGGNPVLWVENTISNICNGAHHVVVFDIDYDGDADVLCCATISNQIVLWLNDGGSPLQWTRKIPAMFFSGALRVGIGDFDLDGDDDIVGSAYVGHDVSWWNREGNDPIDWVEKEIDTFCQGAWALDVCDIDNDGDVDVFAGATQGIMWYENLLLPLGDLECTGTLSWSDVPAGSVISDSFSVKNIGVDVSMLDWEIVEWPEWGSWSFIPCNGSGLSPSAGVNTVEVEVMVPDKKNSEFSGKIMVVNLHDPTDFEEISVSLSTPMSFSFFYDRFEFLSGSLLFRLFVCIIEFLG
jgi:hypothetical protein